VCLTPLPATVGAASMNDRSVDQTNLHNRSLNRGTYSLKFSLINAPGGVCHMAFFSDPDGNALMLHNRYAPKPKP